MIRWYSWLPGALGGVAMVAVVQGPSAFVGGMAAGLVMAVATQAAAAWWLRSTSSEAERERVRIVAWLRAHAEEYRRLALLCREDSDERLQMEGACRAMHEKAGGVEDKHHWRGWP